MCSPPSPSIVSGRARRPARARPRAPSVPLSSPPCARKRLGRSLILVRVWQGRRGADCVRVNLPVALDDAPDGPPVALIRLGQLNNRIPRPVLFDDDSLLFRRQSSLLTISPLARLPVTRNETDLSTGRAITAVCKYESGHVLCVRVTNPGYYIFKRLKFTHPICVSGWGGRRPLRSRSISARRFGSAGHHLPQVRSCSIGYRRPSAPLVTALHPLPRPNAVDLRARLTARPRPMPLGQALTRYRFAADRARPDGHRPGHLLTVCHRAFSPFPMLTSELRSLKSLPLPSRDILDRGACRFVRAVLGAFIPDAAWGLRFWRSGDLAQPSVPYTQAALDPFFEPGGVPHLRRRSSRAFPRHPNANPYTAMNLLTLALALSA